MSGESVKRLGKGAAVALALGLLAAGWSGARVSVGAQVGNTNNAATQMPATPARTPTTNAAPAANSNQTMPSPPQGARPPGQGGGGKLGEIARSIAGHEEEPAEKVFKNIQQFKGMPAGRLLRVMGAYTRALGVNCAHCHVIDQWEKDDKPTKQIAREMTKMTAAINATYLKEIKNLQGPTPTVSCWTCHRGQTKPEASLPVQPRPGPTPTGS